MKKAGQGGGLFGVLFTLLPKGTAVMTFTDQHDRPEQFVLVDGLVLGQLETVFHRVNIQFALGEFLICKKDSCSRVRE